MSNFHTGELWAGTQQFIFTLRSSYSYSPSPKSDWHFRHLYHDLVVLWMVLTSIANLSTLYISYGNKQKALGNFFTSVELIIYSFGTDKINTYIFIIFITWCYECFRCDWFIQLKYLQTLYHSVKFKLVRLIHTLAVHLLDLSISLWFGTLYIESAELGTLRRAPSSPWRRGAAHLTPPSGI